MYKKTITLDLSSHGISKTIQQLEAFTAWVEQKTSLLMSKLSQLGLDVARINFGSVMPYYNNGNGADATITVEPIENGYAIQASGEDVCFIEFGAGVTYGEGYSGNRPEGIVGIGEYGKGRGANPKGWWYKKEGEDAVHTLGNPPAEGMFAAEQTIRQQVYNVAKEVFA